jgi:hypothetical protein
MSKKLVAHIAQIDLKGQREEYDWNGGPEIRGRSNILEVTFFQFPTQEELYTLVPATTPETKWRFEGWEEWNKGNISALMGAYE